MNWKAQVHKKLPFIQWNNNSSMNAVVWKSLSQPLYLNVQLPGLFTHIGPKYFRYKSHNSGATHEGT